MRRGLLRGYLQVRGRPLLSYLDAIEKSQWLPREELRSLQAAKLRAVLEHAGRTVPYYRLLFGSAGFDPGRVRGAEDLSGLPPLDRDTLVTRLHDLRSEQAARGGELRATGGSTGRPVRFVVDRHERTTRSAHLYRNLRWLGWDLGRRAAYVWGSDVDSREHRGTLARLGDALKGVLWLNAFTMTERDRDAWLDRLARFAPEVIIGYPSSLHLLARRALETGRRLETKGVQTSAEMLAEPVRRDIEAAFGGPVRDRYGCREAGVVAHECPRGRYHVNAEAVVMESLDGQVLLTTLNNYAMPLVRYANEDLAVLSEEPCPCGRGLPVVARLQGRRSDVIVSPGGRLIHGEFFTHLFYGASGVTRFQVRQTSLDGLEISVVAGDAFTDEARRRIEAAVLDHGDPGFRIAWRRVEDLPAGPSGKFRFTISDIRSRHPET